VLNDARRAFVLKFTILLVARFFNASWDFVMLQSPCKNKLSSTYLRQC
jgi:hypothetical protein